MLPDLDEAEALRRRLKSQCTYRCVVLPDNDLHRVRRHRYRCLNAPTGAWCSLTFWQAILLRLLFKVSMHLQVRGAP